MHSIIPVDKELPGQSLLKEATTNVIGSIKSCRN